MTITVNLYYTGADGAARAFAEEMEESGTADAIRAEEGNVRYRYFQPLDDPQTVLLVDAWADQAGARRAPRLAPDGQDRGAARQVRPAHDRGALRDRRCWRPRPRPGLHSRVMRARRRHPYRMKFVVSPASCAGSSTPAARPASRHLSIHAMLRPSWRMVQRPSASASVSSAALPCTLFQ